MELGEALACMVNCAIEHGKTEARIAPAEPHPAGPQQGLQQYPRQGFATLWRQLPRAYVSSATSILTASTRDSQSAANPLSLQGASRGRKIAIRLQQYGQYRFISAVGGAGPNSLCSQPAIAVEPCG